MTIAEKIGALSHAIETMQRAADKGGMEGFAALGTVKALTAMRDDLVAEMNRPAIKQEGKAG